ncbi:helix-turn-helix transcriptional regulator [Sorangium sp. So ce233]|uniref:helix-turn-helix transcriptional regulator n=1 Tax=Sorangium sp. So ce233 TaxID=3133290 RepID=UPI003F621AE6
MIRNDREYRITKARAAEFEKSLEAMRGDVTPSVHPKIHKAQMEAVSSQLADLRVEIGEYEALRDGKRRVLELTSLEQLPRALIEGRIAAGLTQRDLAERLGIAEQQVQRYEATEYASASFARLVEVAQAIGLSIKEDVFLPQVDLTAKAFLHRVSSAGVDRDFARRVLLDVEDDDSEASDILRAAAATQRIFGWSPPQLIGSAAPLPTPAAVHSALFKVYGKASEERTVFLAAFGKYVAQLAVKATPYLSPRTLPTDAVSFRAAVMEAHGKVDLTAVLETLWRFGVLVVPLSESGGFHGACWRLERRNVLVIKQRTRSEARWLHDILHETHHAASMPDETEFAWLDDESMPLERRKAPEEKRATRFAGDVLLDSKAEQIAKQCVAAAARKADRLKSVVPRIAETHDVPVGALANYLAWRLEMDGVNWWGAASNLQGDGADPWLVTRDFLIPRLDWSQLDRLDRELLTKALEDPR